jgi:hypothetical protein
MDWWVAFFFAGNIVVSAAAVGGIIWLQPPLILGVFLVLFLIPNLAAAFDNALFTHYILTADSLEIHSNLHHVAIPYRLMEQVRPGGIMSLVTMGWRRRFSLSPKGLEIVVHDFAWKVISISPMNTDEFMMELVERIETERQERVSSGLTDNPANPKPKKARKQKV